MWVRDRKIHKIHGDVKRHPQGLAKACLRNIY